MFLASLVTALSRIPQGWGLRRPAQPRFEGLLDELFEAWPLDPEEWRATDAAA
jgi:hypothetical protein